MSKFLINVKEIWRVDSEAEVNSMIEEAKNAKNFNLTKYDCTHKELKAKGEVIDEWYRVTLTKEFTSEKEPGFSTTPEYITEDF